MVTSQKIDFTTLTVGYAARTTNYSTTSTSASNPVGLSTTFTVPAGGARYKVTFQSFSYTGSSTSGDYGIVTVWDGGVGSGTLILNAVNRATSATIDERPICQSSIVTLSAGSHTLNVGLYNPTGPRTVTLQANASVPMFLLVERC